MNKYGMIPLERIFISVIFPQVPKDQCRVLRLRLFSEENA
jgi:hypothetical protein